MPVWLSFNTKQHLVDKKRLKPGKIAVPHSLNSSPALKICLITADPQRAVKDVVAHPAFPSDLRSRITKIIGFQKLKERYKSFESRRQLHAEHDIFLADDRILTRLVDTLGKIFYGGHAKRPIPINIALLERVDGKRVKKDQKKSKDEQHAAVGSPAVVAKEIERALNAVPVSMRPGTSTALIIAKSSFTPQQLAENIEAAVQGMVEKYIVKGWRNVKGIHVKGPQTAAMPIWLADDLWTDDTNVVENAAEDTKPKAIEGSDRQEKKRKSLDNAVSEPKESKRSKKG